MLAIASTAHNCSPRVTPETNNSHTPHPTMLKMFAMSWRCHGGV